LRTLVASATAPSRLVASRSNTTEGYRYGVYAAPQGAHRQPLWLVADNVASVLTTDQRVQVTNNIS